VLTSRRRVFAATAPLPSRHGGRSINKRDEEQARYLILSSAAFYRVKVHPKSGKIQRHVRTSLSDLELVQKGVFKVGAGRTPACEVAERR